MRSTNFPSTPEAASDPLASLACPLCGNDAHLRSLAGVDQRHYRCCPQCQLIFVEPGERPSRREERKRYALHQNSANDSGYVRFLRQLLTPLTPHLTLTSRCLDYGCGPAPVLANLLREQGYVCDIYDPFFADLPLHPPYDCILACECCEHFHEPARDFARICSLLAPRGLLAIMSERWTTPAHFATWSYTRDFTHVSFFHRKTLAALCRLFGLELLWQDQQRVALFRKTVLIRGNF